MISCSDEPSSPVYSWVTFFSMANMLVRSAARVTRHVVDFMGAMKTATSSGIEVSDPIPDEWVRVQGGWVELVSTVKPKGLLREAVCCTSPRDGTHILYENKTRTA